MRKRSEVGTDTKEPPKQEAAAQETSSKLKDELEKNAPDRIEFESARGGASKVQPAKLTPDFERITETVFVDNAFDTYKKLEDALRVGQKRNDHGSVNAALDEAESNARLAHKLWMTAKLERERWELDNAQIFASMRQQATSILQSEKEQGKRSKQITDADVENMMAAIFGDEWKHHELRRRKVRSMEDSMAHLNEMWISRCRSLQTMLGKSR